ncbi:MAG: hypothetical protein GEV12_23940 [Micromonosporaceae bacterium]|nr:hypothetical protein [Micromonosporaceae bacterium]
MPVLGWEPMVWRCDGCDRQFTERPVAEWEDQDWLPELMDGQDRTWCQRCKLARFGLGPVC